MHPTVEQIARVCHETNRGWCEATGDFSQVPWGDAPDWVRESAIKGVQAVVTGTGDPQTLHDKWAEAKTADGWTFGPVKDEVLKHHPCLVDYEALPPEQRVKDKLFLSVVNTLMRAGR